MSARDWQLVGMGGRALLAIVAVHGVGSRQWRELHTIGLIVCAIAVLGSELA